MKRFKAVNLGLLALLSSLAVLLDTKPVSAQGGYAGQPESRVYPWRALPPTSHVPGTGTPIPPTLPDGKDRIRLFQSSVRLQDPVPAAGNSANLSDEVPNPPSSVPKPAVEQSPGLSVQSNARPDLDVPGQGQNRDWCRIGDVQRLFPPNDRGLSIGGFSQVGIHGRDSLNFNRREDKFNVHQSWFYIDQATDPCAGRHFGFRLDGLYGLDAQAIQAVGNSPVGAPSGWDNSWDNGSFGFALPQAYLEYAASPDTSFRLGRFLSPIGFESVPSVENFFYSRSWARTYTEPFSHSGLLVQNSSRPGLTTFGGITTGWNSAFESADNGLNLLTGFRYAASDRVTLGLAGSVGDTGYRGSGVLQTATAQIQVTDKVVWGLQGDFLNLQSNDEIGLANYLFYCHNRCLSVGSRLEWWKSDQLFGSSRSTWGATTGINWRPHANVVIRPEVRIDGGAAALHPGDPVIAIDAIVLF